MPICKWLRKGNFVSSRNGLCTCEHNYALIKEGAVHQSWDENIEEVGRQINFFNARVLPLLKRLEVV